MTRDEDLVPVRHGRMLVSPFTFYRGAAKIMATDLAGTPTAGLTTQLCGDAHLSNFGVYASPERDLVFDVNDFDETLPGPFEYDVKRMAASFTIAARNNGLTKAETVAATQASARAYREAMPNSGRCAPWTSGTPACRPPTSKRRSPRSPQRAMVPSGPRNPARRPRPARDPRPARAAGKVRPDSAAWAARQAEKNLRKAHTRDSLQALLAGDRGRTRTGR